MSGQLPKDIELLLNKLYRNKDIPVVRPGSKQMKLGYPLLFKYDAKWKSILPYWDALPLSIPIAKYGNGFLGINLHFVPWSRRIQLANSIIKKTKNKNRVTYPDLKAAWKSSKLPEALAMLCIRRYLYSHVRSHLKSFDWETYSEAVRDVRPKFIKKSEKFILSDIMRKFREHANQKGQ